MLELCNHEHRRKKLDKKLLALIPFFLLILGTASAADTQILRVISEQANVYLKPDLGSSVLMIVPMGAFLESTQRENEWYVVILPADDQGFTRQGYIRAEVVEAVEGQKERAAVLPQESPQPEIYIARREKLFSGFMIKFGWMRSPDPGGFDKSWIGGLNFDIGLSHSLALGIELMPSYRNYSDIDLHIIPIMGFINLKTGFNLGGLVKPLGFMNPYTGVGAGVDASYTLVEFEGESYSNFSTKFAYHIFLGLQLNFGGLKIIGEYQLVQAPDANVNPNFWRHYLLFGLRLGR